MQSLKSLWKPAAVALLIAGSFVTGRGCDRGEVAPPVPPDVSVSVADTAKDNSLGYINGLAVEAAISATTAKKFTDWQSFCDDWTARNTACRIRSFKAYEAAMNANIGGRLIDGKWKFPDAYDPKVAERIANEAAEGYRKVSP